METLVDDFRRTNEQLYRLMDRLDEGMADIAARLDREIALADAAQAEAYRQTRTPTWKHELPFPGS